MQEPKIVKKEWGSEKWLVNRDYCGKILILNKGFQCSLHHHKIKDETFYISKGKVLLELDGEKHLLLPGDYKLVMPGQKHRFTGVEDSEIIEFSTHHEESDSYRDEPSRKVDQNTLPSETLTCLVTGGAGFIGSNLALELERLGHNVTIIDNFLSGSRENLSGFKGELIESDICESITFKKKFDVIFHEAAITDPRYGDYSETLRQNLSGFSNVLKLAKEHKAKLIYASTANLYGNGPNPMKEDQPKEIISAYGLSKLMMDEMASHHFNEMHIVGLRYFNVFGPNEAHKGRPASMIYHLAKSMREGIPPKLFSPGDQKRDHIYVADVVAANLKALSAPSGIYNVGTGIATSFNELVTFLNSALGKNLKIEYIPMPYDSKTYQVHTLADTNRAKTLLGFQSKYGLKEGIDDYLGKLK
jgi:ADP-L-glycero-D-manno-heptose 6-epimerase